MSVSEATTTETAQQRADSWCSHGARDVTGADIVRIARTLAVEPQHFTQTAPAKADDPTGIVFDQGRRRVNLRLANAAQGCVFLVRTTTGAGWCGLEDAAPRSCRTYPDDHRQLVEWQADQEHWHAVVSRWNRLSVRGRAKEDPPSLLDFHHYLLEAQAAREAGAPWPEEVQP